MDSQTHKQQTSGRGVTYLLVGAVVALIAANVVYVLLRDGIGSARIDEEAPSFTLPVINPPDGFDGEVELAALQGKVVVLEFFSTT